jgi:hypothetical protein
VGTGKATLGFAVRGIKVVGLEPHPAMATVARRNLAHFPDVRIEVTTFEDWPLEAARFGLVFSAQAWHWVAAEVRCAKAADALVLGGALALYWHRTDWHGEELRSELDALYQRVAPDLHAQRPGFPGTDPPEDDLFITELSDSGRFGDVHTNKHPWSSTFSADGLLDLLTTQSNHRLLAEHRQRALFGALRNLVAEHGGAVTIPFATFVLLARRVA